MDLDNYMSSGKPEFWERAYYEFVLEGKAGIDDWIFLWFWHNIKIPESKEYSIFSPNAPINNSLLNIKIQLACFHQGKKRYLKMNCWSGEELYPYFEYTQDPDHKNIRFESVGNPIIDSVNYRKWEEFLLYKMLSEILLEHGGLDAIATGIRKKL